MFGVCSCVCFLLSSAMLDEIIPLGGSTVRVCTIATHWSLPVAGLCATCWWSLATHGMHRVAAPSTNLSRGSLMLLNQLFPSHPISIYGAYIFGGLGESHPIHLPSLHGGESSLPGLVPFHDMVDCESVLGIKPGDSSVVIGYQVYGFTHTCSAEQFVFVA